MAHLEYNDHSETRPQTRTRFGYSSEQCSGVSRNGHPAPSRRRMIVMTLGIGLALVMVTCLTPILARAYPSADQRLQNSYQRIPGHIVSVLGSRQPIGPAAPDMAMQMSFALKLRNEPALDALIAHQNDPTSPSYHRYLTPQAFNAQFAPTPASVAAVVAFAHQQGFQVTAISSNRVLVNIKGTVATVNHAFDLTINTYQLGSQIVYAPSDDPLLPHTIAAHIQALTGLNSLGIYHPTNLQNRLTPRAPHAGPQAGYTPDELRSAYDVKPLIDAGMDGAGQTIGLFELDGYLPADIAAYRQYYHLGPLHASNVLVDGATGKPSSFAIETTLDMEVISAMAPRATQQVYIGPNTVTGINDTYNRIVTDDAAKVISISWGECELALSSSRLDILNTIFKQGTAQGQSFFAASGNIGAYDCNVNAIQTLSVDSPANNPYVVGVGGTALTTGPHGVYGSESAWANLLGGPNKTAVGGGGGTSIHFLRPSYQSGHNLTNPYRMVPDVSANADPNTGYAIYHTGDSLPRSGWLMVGGTSAAAPLWAGIIIDINQYLLSKHLFPVGSASMALYQLYNTSLVYPPYHDITTGTNLYYKAAPGYDLATGLGTPDAWNIARDLQSMPGLTTQLLQNGGFEAGSLAWQQSSAGGYQLISTVNPYSGTSSASFCGYANCHDALRQTTLLPKFIRRVALSYWVSIGRGDSSTTCQDHLQVFLRTANGGSIATIQKLCNTEAYGWMHYRFDVTDALAPYAGQIIQVVFEVNGTSGPRSPFLVDIDDVELQSLAVAAGITAQFIKNPGFEDGQAPWLESSKGGYQLISNNAAHTGASSVFLCGYPHCDDALAQTVTLPKTTQHAVLSYWLFLGRADTDTSCHDQFYSSVKVRTAQGKPIATLQTLCNTDATGWALYSFDVTNDLLPYLGQPVQIVFRTTGSVSKRANFFVYIDDITLYATYA